MDFRDGDDCGDISGDVDTGDGIGAVELLTVYYWEF
jgi:hypothetical protein